MWTRVVSIEYSIEYFFRVSEYYSDTFWEKVSVSVSNTYFEYQVKVFDTFFPHE